MYTILHILILMHFFVTWYEYLHVLAALIIIEVKGRSALRMNIESIFEMGEIKSVLENS